MISWFFSKANDARSLFDGLRIAESENYEVCRNQYPVVHISFNDVPRDSRSYEAYINRIQNRIIKDLQKEFPDVDFDPEDAVWDAFMTLYM